MKKYAWMIALFAVAVAGCVATQETTMSKPTDDMCPLPTGFKLDVAVEQAERTMMLCPHKLDPVFFRLVEIGKHSPNPENSVKIQNLLKTLRDRNKVSETYAKTLYQKYFSVKFVGLPDVKPYNLSGEIEVIKRQLREELAFKKVGMLECCNDKESYAKAETEYLRLVAFMENVVLNEDYMKELK